MKLKPSLFPAILLIALLTIQLLPGCAPSPERSRLEHIEAIIDEHPDSAMALLDSVDTAALRSDRDRALYDLLYNLALYKSFNDSLNEESLKFSSNHFTDNKEYSRAAKSYYLLGNLYEARKNFGQSAVSQTKGIEMARKAKDNYALGLCEMSLWAVYGKIYDTNRQIIAAKSAQDAFDKCSRNDWKIYATLNLATAFNNNGNYDSAIIIANEIINDPVNWKDSILIGSAYETIALSAMDINDSLSITSYAKALRYNGFSLSSGANENIGVLLSSINQNIISESDRYILNEYLSKIDHTPFAVLAKMGKYREAYNALNKYRIEQDSFIRKMMTRSVDSSVEEYHLQNASLLRSELKASRILWITSAGVSLFILLFICIFTYRISKKRKKERNALITEAEALTNSLKIQTEQNYLLTQSIKELLSSKLIIVERLCESYDENDGKRTAKEIKAFIKDVFLNKNTIENIVKTINRHTDNLIKKFYLCYPKLKEDEYRLYIFSVAGLSASALSLIFDESKEVIYNRKSRLKAKIKNSGLSECEIFLSYLN
jgi:tetratricopeptide (TPR) repeat protein